MSSERQPTQLARRLTQCSCMLREVLGNSASVDTLPGANDGKKQKAIDEK